MTTFSTEIERLILGAMIYSQDNLKIAFEKDPTLVVKDFYHKEHQEIFQALKFFHASNREVDLTVMVEELKRRDLIEKVGGVYYLTHLVQMVGTSTYFEPYVKELKDYSLRRELIHQCQLIHGAVLSGEHNIASLALEASEKFEKLGKNVEAKKSFSLREVAKGEKGLSIIDQIKEKTKKYMEEGKISLPGISTRYSFLDSILGGLRKENFILIAARPGIGKTAFALNLVRNLGMINNIPVALFSLEMSRQQIFLRLLATQSGVQANKIETGCLNESELEQFETAIQQLESSKIFINDFSYDVLNIISQMRKLHDEEGINIFFIDYIGLVESTKSREIKAYEIGDITRSLKSFANLHGVTIICLAQLNRQADQNNKPQLSMLRDSGNLEQDADSVVFLYDPNDKQGQMEVIVAKNRHGAIGMRSFYFKKETGLISEPNNQQHVVSWE